VLAFTPFPYNYGQVMAGHTASQTFTLTNTGGKASGTVTITLPGSAEFTITAGTCAGRPPSLQPVAGGCPAALKGVAPVGGAELAAPGAGVARPLTPFIPGIRSGQ
jgi:hypothetical protein